MRVALLRSAVTLLCAARFSGFGLALAAFAVCPGGVPEAAAAPASVEPQAVGRLNHAGYSQRRHCTFFAIAPKVALTAVHCVGDLPPEEIHLLYGYARMTWVAQGAVEAMVPVGFDMMALCLADAAPATLDIGSFSAIEAPVRVVGYAIPKAHVLNVNSCRAAGQMVPDALMIDCAAPQGMSGGPVVDDAGRAVGVVSLSGPQSAIAEAIPDWAAEACDGEPPR